VCWVRGSSGDGNVCARDATPRGAGRQRAARRLAAGALLSALVWPAAAGAERWEPDVAGAAAWRRRARARSRSPCERPRGCSAAASTARITARDQTRFFLDVERLLPERHRAYALRLLGTIVPPQRWGMAQVILNGSTLHFKGGWGSGTGTVDHQVGLLRRGPHRVAIAVLTTGSSSHAYGKATLTGVSRGCWPDRNGSS
jgi:hypothetical protein